MQPTRGPTLSVRVRGEWACFTRPEMKVERVSYSVITPSAARGVLEAVLWKPAIQWHIDRIKVLKPIHFFAMRRNEVNLKAASPKKQLIEQGGVAPHLDPTEERAQRNMVALRDVDYVIDAHFTMTDKAGPEDNLTKFVEMFTRRLSKGQHFHQPYLGCREFPAIIEPADDSPPPEPISEELGLMLWDMDYGSGSAGGKKKTPIRPIFFAARIVDGVIEVPANPEAELVAAGGVR